MNWNFMAVDIYYRCREIIVTYSRCISRAQSSMGRDALMDNDTGLAHMKFALHICQRPGAGRSRYEEISVDAMTKWRVLSNAQE